MADAPVAQRPKLPTVETLKRVWGAILGFFRMPEGWSTFFLVFFLVFVVELSILRAEWAGELRILPSVTFMGLLAGFILARLTQYTPLRNWQAVLLGLLAGAAAIWWRTLTVIDDRFGGARGKSVELVQRIGRYIKGAWNGYAEDDLFLFVLVIAALLCFFGFFAMWWTFRSHWISPTIGLGGLILLVNLGYDRADSGLFLGMFLLCAVPLTIRFHAFRQQAQWDAARITYPESLGMRFLSVSSAITILLLLFANLVPFSVRSGPINTAWQAASVPWDEFEGRFERFFPSIEGRGRTRNTFPGFAAFGDSFQLGAGLNLPEDPAISLRCDTIPAQYIKMNTYDTYTGRGFKKKISEEFKAQQPDGNTYDPRVSLDANKAVPLPPPDQQTAKSASCSAQLYRPRGNILPVVGAQLEQMNTPTLVSLGWQSFNLAGAAVPPSKASDLPVPLADLLKKVTNLQGLTVPTEPPPTLRPGAQGQVSIQRDGTLVIYVPQGANATFTPEQLARLVGQAQQQAATQGGPPPRIYRVTVVQAPVIQPSPTAASAAASATVHAPGTPQPTATPQPVAPLDRRFDAITEEQNRLAASLMQTQVVVENGKVTAILYRGQAPNFNDIDAVVSTAPVPVGKDVTENIRVSEATADQLRTAPKDLPKWTERYTQLPDGITQRTADLAQTLSKGATNEYDTAMSIEQYLRANYLYSEKVNLPPFDRDVTDYFLFTSKQGYGEYFSTAMLVLMRLNGIPTREVVGYLPGARAEDGRLVSRENQAHAWVEAWFPQYGWVAFDPTPRPGVAPITRGPQLLPTVATDPEAGVPGDLAGGQDRLDARGEDRLRQLDEELGGGVYDSDPSLYRLSQRREISPLAIAIPLLFAVFVLALAFLWLRMFRGLSGAAPWYARMMRAAGVTGLARAGATTTPFEAAAAVAHRLPGSREPAMTIAQQYAEERYANRPGDAAASKNAWMHLRRLIVQSALPGNRRRDRTAAVNETPAINPRGRRQR